MQSFFDGILSYLHELIWGLRSIFGSGWVIFPYLFGLGEMRKEVTEQYPDPVSSKTEDDLPARSRGLLSNDIEICTGCGDCVKICPVTCIKLSVDPGGEISKTWVNTFDIDISRCLYCGLCTDVCHPRSLSHTKAFGGAAYGMKHLVLSFGRGQLTHQERERLSAARQTQDDDYSMIRWDKPLNPRKEKA